MNNQKPNTNFSESDYIQDFNNQLSKYPQLKQYVYFNSSSDSKENQEAMNIFLNFYSKNVLESVPTFTDLSENMIYFYSSDNLKIHIVTYLSHKIWKIKVQKYQEKVSIFSTLTFLLHSFEKKYVENKIVIKYQKLINDFQSECSLIKYMMHFIHQIKLKSHLVQIFNPNKKKLYTMFIRDVSKCNTNNNYAHCLQHVFEAAITSKQFIFYKEIKFLIQSYQDSKHDAFNNAINSVARKISNHFGVNKSDEAHILLISLMRYVYDQICPLTFREYFTNAPKNIILTTSSIAFKQLHTNIRLFPPSTRPSKQFCTILRKDSYYRKAINYLEEIQFMTNPLDMLLCIQRSLDATDKASRFYSHIGSSKSFNFNEIIQIFLAVTISSDIPEIIEIHKFINDFFFDDILFPELCFARAALKSCIANLIKLDKAMT